MTLKTHKFHPKLTISTETSVFLSYWESKTFDSSSGTIDLRLNERTEMDSQVTKTSADQLAFRSIDESVNQAADPIFRRVEDLYPLLASQTELETTGNRGASGSRHDNASARPSRHRNHRWISQRLSEAPFQTDGKISGQKVNVMITSKTPLAAILDTNERTASQFNISADLFAHEHLLNGWNNWPG